MPMYSCRQIATGLAICMCAASPAFAQFQYCYVPVESESNSITIRVDKYDGTACNSTTNISSIVAQHTSVNGSGNVNAGYIKTSPSYAGAFRMHAAPATDGACQVWAFYPTCQYYAGTDDRYLGYTDQKMNGTVFNQLTVSWPFPQSYDSWTPTHTQLGPRWGTETVGTYVYTAATAANATGCYFTNPIQSGSITFHTSTCKPEWFWQDQEKETGVNFHGPASGTITIAVPSGFSAAQTAAENAAKAWATATGRTITAQANTTCGANSPLCIELDDDHGLDPNDRPGSCASFGTHNQYNTTTGEWLQHTRIRLKPTWNSSTPNQDKLQKIIAHELGHYFGLWNLEHSSCTFENSVMSGVADCDYTVAPTSGAALGPTSSDALFLNATYGSMPKAICGW